MVTGGSWMALDPATGKIVWQTADPQTETLPAPTGTVGVWDLAPVTAANGVVFTASLAKSGNELYALDAATGSILWAFPVGSSVNAAPAVVDGSVYWGTGYARAAEGSGNTKLYAFSIDGVVDTTPPATTIALSPASPNGSTGWYRSAVNVSVSAADNPGGVGVYETRCAVDPAGPPAGFDALPAACPPATVGADGTHTVYAASEDRDNNVESPPVTMTFKIDATPPTISAAPTTPPNANGWYSGDVVVHFTCTDAGSGIPAGACPPDQTLTGIGEAISSTSETVTDGAGNTSAPSNAVTVMIVNAPGLCAETRQDVHGSAEYRFIGALLRYVVDAEVDSACGALRALARSSRPAYLRLYDAFVNDLRFRFFLTGKQARELKTLAGGI
jgi:hypothetical protein